MRVEGVGLRVLGLRVQCLGFRAAIGWGQFCDPLSFVVLPAVSGFRVWGFDFRVLGFGFWVQGLGIGD